MAGLETNRLTKLNDTEVGSEYSVVAVIKFARSPTRSQTGYHLFMSLIDESVFFTIDSKLCVNLFVTRQENWDEIRPFRIIRLHRLKIQRYRDKKQGYGQKCCHFIILDEDPEASLTPIYSSSVKFTPLNSCEIERVKELRSWVRENLRLFERCEDSTPVRLSEVKPGQYFHVTCQVLSCTSCDALDCFLLHILDGTPLNRKLHRTVSLEEVVDLEKWNCPLAALEPLVIEVQVDRCYSDSLNGVKAGDFLRLKNLHAFLHSDADGDQFLKFSLHKGSLLEAASRDLRETREISARLDALRPRSMHIAPVVPPRDDLIIYRNGKDDINANDNRKDAVEEDGDGSAADKEDNCSSINADCPNSASSSTVRKRPFEELRESWSFLRSPGNDAEMLTQGSSTETQGVCIKKPRIAKKSCSVQVDAEAENQARMDSPNAREDFCAQTSNEEPDSLPLDRDVSSTDDDEDRGGEVEEETGAGHPSRSEVMDSSIGVERTWDGHVIDADSSTSRLEEFAHLRQDSFMRVRKSQGGALTMRTLHEEEELIPLRYVARAVAPSNFRVRAKIVNYCPKPCLSTLFVQLHCSLCNSLKPLHCLKSRDKICNWSCRAECSRASDRSNQIQCLACKSKSMNSTMRHVFTFLFLLFDEEDAVYLPVNLWGDEAVNLLGDLCPREVAGNKHEMMRLKNVLDRLLNNDVVCCISMDHYDDGESESPGNFFQIFDTVLSDQ